MKGKHSNKNNKQNLDIKTTKSKVIIVVCLLLFIIGTIIFIIANQNQKNQINDFVNSTFTLLKDGDKSNLQNKLDYNVLINSLDEVLLEENIEFENYLFTDLSWQIKNIQIDQDKAVVTIEAINKDYKNIFTEWTKDVINAKKKNKNFTEEAAYKLLQEKIEKETKKRMRTKDITLLKNENNWTVWVDNNLRDLVFPGVDIINNVLTENK